MDLQKIAEITFKNEKFNVLKPTLHIITDYFKDFILQRRNEDVGRIFLDRNGFRHVWEGMEAPEVKSLRKTELLLQKKTKEIYNKSNVKEPTSRDFNSTNNNTNIIKDKPRRKQKIKDDVYIPKKVSLRDSSTLVTTTFFCPFFGLIKMSSDIENFEEKKNDGAT